MSALEEIREKLLALDSFIQENTNIEPRLPVKNLDALRDYYNNIRNIIIEELEYDAFSSIPRIIDQNKINIESRTTLIMDSYLREQSTLVKMFNEDLNNGMFKDSLLKNGIFLPNMKTKYMKNPPDYLLLNQATGRKNVDVYGILFLFDKNALIHNELLNEALRNNLKQHIYGTQVLTPTQYGLIREFFLETAPFVLNALLLKFKEAYISAKKERLPVILSQAILNTDVNQTTAIVLETLYNELLKQGVFKGTIFEDAITKLTSGRNIMYNPILMDPTKDIAPTKQYNLRLIMNTERIEDNSSKRLCYKNNPR